MIQTDNHYIHTLNGRLRVKVPAIRRQPDFAKAFENDLACMTGIISVQANPMTGNVLVRFDPTQVDEVEVISAVSHLSGYRVPLPAETEPESFEIHPMVANLGRELGKQLLKNALPGWAASLVEFL